MSYIGYMGYMNYMSCLGCISGNKAVGQPKTED